MNKIETLRLRNLKGAATAIISNGKEELVTINISRANIHTKIDGWGISCTMDLLPSDSGELFSLIHDDNTKKNQFPYLTSVGIQTANREVSEVVNELINIWDDLYTWQQKYIAQELLKNCLS